jgi:AcrR family transcriptional regulator
MASLPPDPTIRRQVMASARGLLAEDPGIPLAAIASRAGVSRATIYRHFGSRRGLLQAVALEPPASARERIMSAAAELIGPHGLSGFSMEQLADSASVSRSTVYRLFPTKADLFGELLRTYSPFDEMLAIVDQHPDDPPDVVLPAIARAMAHRAPRIGLLRSVILEVARGNVDALRGVQPLVPMVAGRLAAYLERQMAAGTIRRAHPILAIQSLLGPVAFHLLTRPVAERLFGMTTPVEDVAEQLANIVLHGLAQAGDAR